MKTSLVEMSQILATSFIFFPGIEITEPLVRAWHLFFKDEDPMQLAAAFQVAIKNNSSGFAPTPGQVEKILKSLQQKETRLELASEAWEAAWHGYPETSEMAKKAARLVGDWDNRFMWKLDIIPFRRRDFERIFNELKERTTEIELQEETQALTYGNLKLLKG